MAGLGQRMMMSLIGMSDGLGEDVPFRVCTSVPLTLGRVGKALSDAKDGSLGNGHAHQRVGARRVEDPAVGAVPLLMPRAQIECWMCPTHLHLPSIHGSNFEYSAPQAGGDPWDQGAFG